MFLKLSSRNSMVLILQCEKFIFFCFRTILYSLFFAVWWVLVKRLTQQQRQQLSAICLSAMCDLRCQLYFTLRYPSAGNFYKLSFYLQGLSVCVCSTRIWKLNYNDFSDVCIFIDCNLKNIIKAQCHKVVLIDRSRSILI